VEENTCEEGGARNTLPSTTLSEEPSHPQSAQGSDDEREGGGDDSVYPNYHGTSITCNVLVLTDHDTTYWFLIRLLQLF
jgi:hypothetical protein